MVEPTPDSETRSRPTGGASDAIPDVEGIEASRGLGPVWTQLAEKRWGPGRGASAVGLLILLLAVGLTGFQLYIALWAGLDARQQRLLHLMLTMVMAFLILPPFKMEGKGGWTVRLLTLALTRARGNTAPAGLLTSLRWVGGIMDVVLIVAAVVVSLYPIAYQAELASRAGAYTETDWLLGVVLIVVLLEATRRAVGLAMVIIVSAFMYYAMAGWMIPGQFGHSGARIERIATQSYLGDGVYGLTLGVVVTFVFVFILFGALLSKTGGGNFFVSLAYVLTGRMVGGPAKGAVLGSAMMGSVSGSAIANVVTTGPFTIPLMRRVGYKRHDAAGIEAAASTGGQVLPPIMGAGAFIMAERIGIPYADIVKVAILPALLYFGVMFLFVDILARKYDIGRDKDEALPRMRTVMRAGWHFLAPLVLLIVLLLNYVSPTQAGLYACGALLVVTVLRWMVTEAVFAVRSGRLRLTRRDLLRLFIDFLEVFVLAARNTLPVSVACAVAGIIVAMVGLTGLGLTLSHVMLTVFAGNLLLTLLMVAVASLIMGMGLPVTASYVVLAVLAVPALEELGLAVIVAHMIVYWYSQDSNVTPPVAFAAFAAAGVAEASPMRSGVSAWKFAKGLYLIPVLMAYTALMALDGPIDDVVVAVASGCVALAASAIAIEGYFLRRTLIGERVGLILAAALVMVAPEWSALFHNALSATVDPGVFVGAGSVLGVVLIGLQVFQHLRDRPRKDDPADAPAKAATLG